jgi:hypothetical protein
MNFLTGKTRWVENYNLLCEDATFQKRLRNPLAYTSKRLTSCGQLVKSSMFRVITADNSYYGSAVAFANSQERIKFAS